MSGARERERERERERRIRRIISTSMYHGVVRRRHARGPHLASATDTIASIERNRAA